MILYRCDGCGKEQSVPFKCNAKLTIKEKEQTYKEKHYDLCDKCMEEFTDWFGFRKTRTRGEQD